MTQRSQKQRASTTIRLPLWGLGLIILLAVLFLAGSSIWLFRTVQKVASDWQATQPEFNVPAQSGVDAAQDPAIHPPQISSDNQPVLTTDSLKPWSGRDRVTVLFLGIDQRCDDDGPTRTDSIMLLTIDPVGRNAGALSIPRDLWVEIPGFAIDRINQAHYLGEVYNYPGGGPALAMATVEAAIGVNIDHYVTVNFDAFIKIIDLIGGIEIDVPEAIDDPLYPDECYGYDPFYINAGRQTLDGETALKYARTRATFLGDVDRAGRQQAVVLAVRDRVLQLDMVPQLLSRAPELWLTFQDNVRTSLTLEEGIQLGLLAKEIPRNQIEMVVLDFDYVYNETTPEGQQVLIPNRDEIRLMRNRLFAPPAIPTPVIHNLPARMAAEEAQIALYNGTAIFGLAAATQEYLLDYDVIISEIGNADRATYRTTQIIDYGDHTYTTLYLAQLLNVPPLNISSGVESEGNYDVLVILGNDWGESFEE